MRFLFINCENMALILRRKQSIDSLMLMLCALSLLDFTILLYFLCLVCTVVILKVCNYLRLRTDVRKSLSGIW